MNKLVLIGVYLLGCAVVAEESLSDNGDSEPVSADQNCRWFPLTLFDWNGQTSDTNIDTSDSDTVHSGDAASFADGGTVSSLIERLLLFPVCLIQEENCYKVFKSADAGDTGTPFQICQNNDDLSLLEYVIDAGQKALKNIITYIEETYTMYGLGNATVPSVYLHDIYQGILHSLDHASPSVLSTLQNLCSYVETIQASIMAHLSEFTVPGFGISSKDIGISSKDFGLSSIVQQLFRETTMTAIRYIVVGIIAMSLFPSGRQIGKYARKAMRLTKRRCGLPNETRGSERRFQPSLCAIAEHSSEDSLLTKLESVLDSIRPSALQRPSPVTEQMLKEHYPMCECFDYRNCNCDGKPFCKESTQNATHFNMCEFFDLLPCNCGGAAMSATSTDCDTSTDTPQDERDLESNFCDNCKTACTKPAVTTTEQSVQASPDVTSRDTSPESSFQTSNIECRLPHWVKMAVGHYHMRGSTVLSCRRNLNENDNEAEIADNSNTSNVSPLNLSQAASEVSPEPVDDSTYAAEKDSPKAVQFVSSEQFKQRDSPKKVQFVSVKQFEHARDELDKDECLPVHLDTLSDMDSDEETPNRYLDDSATSDIGSPYINPRFKEESPYIMANAVASSDLRDRGDGAVYSTLTRRSPYVEEGLSDLSEDMSCRGSEGSILDVSDINNSVSFTSGEGLLEVAALFALQTIWRLAKQVWHRKLTDTSCNDVAIEEKESGLYIIRQNNISKGFRSPRHPQNKKSVENDGELNENDSKNTETILQYEIINTVRKREVLKTSTAEETNYHRNYGTFSDRTQSTQQHQSYSRILLDHCQNLELFAEDNNQGGNTDSNNNARYSKRKRDTSKRQSDSDDKADCEDCDCTNNVSRKRGRIVYKTRETFHQCHTGTTDQSDITERRRVNKIVTRTRAINAKRKLSKTRSSLSTHKEKRQKCSRTRKDLSKPNRSQPSDFQVSIDRLSRDLRNASVSNTSGKYVGDTSDEFADESSSSSDEMSRRKSLSSKTEDKFATFQKPSRYQDKVNHGNASTSDVTACSRKRVKGQHKELNDIICKLRSLRCNAWELKDYRYINKSDNTSKVLAWAWSCVEK